MMTEKTITIPIYHYCLRIVVCDEIEDALNKYHIKNTKQDGCFIDYGDRGMICITPDSGPTIVHECEHAKNAIWNLIGHSSNPVNDEPDAYLLEYIYEQVMKVVNKHLASKEKK